MVEYLRYFWQLVDGVRSRKEYEAYKQREHDIMPYIDLDCPLNILDLANGRLRPQYTLLRAAGHHVWGIDLVNYPRFSWTNAAYGIARKIYTWRLNLPQNANDSQRLIYGDVTTLPFVDHHFDLVTSIAAFEHFLHVPEVVAELARVIRPGGMTWICLHPFTSPSGGHNVKLAEVPLKTLPAGVEAWDHLRKRRLPFHVPLNQWRISQYLDTFAEHFEILDHYCLGREGEALLTPEIEAELADYSRDELTCGSYVIVARRPIP